MNSNDIFGKLGLPAPLTSKDCDDENVAGIVYLYFTCSGYLILIKKLKRYSFRKVSSISDRFVIAWF